MIKQPEQPIMDNDTTPPETEPFLGKESNLVGQILNYFSHSDRYHLFRCNSGKVLAFKNGRYYWVTLAPKGTPDIIGFDTKTGNFIGIETKVKKNKSSFYQEIFAEKLKGSDKGVYILAHSLDDVLNRLLGPKEPLPF